MEEGIFMLSMLLDFYGELLTEKQRECFDLYYNEDLSLAEIAEQSGISRQAVWTNIRHAEDSLRSIEEKTGLIARLSEYRNALESVRGILSNIIECGNKDTALLAQSAITVIDDLHA